MSFIAINPASGEEVTRHDPHSDEMVEELVASAVAAQRVWRALPIEARVEPLRALASVLRDRKDEYAAVMTEEMGKPLQQAVGEVEKCAWACDFFSDNAAGALTPVSADTDASRSYWTYQPLGLVLGIMPWNFPFWQVVRFAAPALTAGNAVLVKHASSVPGCALGLADAFSRAGYGEGLYTNLFIENETSSELIGDPRIRAVSLTGSVRAGRAVAARAGEAIKKCVLELGGSDPSVVLADADLDIAVSACMTGRMNNTGQSCIAAKRFIVVDEIADAFEERITKAMADWPMGDPLHPETGIGPMAREDLRDGLHDQVERSVEAGARLVTGGTVPDRPGAWYPPTLLVDVGPGMPAYEEELFGPVAVIIRAEDEEDAIRIANDTTFGLGASVYTSDSERGERIAAERLDAGCCFVNGFVKSDPRLPFGGTKDSGYGRELSTLALHEFTNVKTVWVK